MSASISIIGRLGRDVETKNVGSGTLLATAPVAVSRGYGEKKHTIWIKVCAWGKDAEFFAKYGRKGMLCYATGEFDIEEYEKNGEKRSMPKLDATTTQCYTTERTEKPF